MKKWDHVFEAEAEDSAWETTEAYMAYTGRFDALFSYLKDENIKLGPEGQFAILNWLENKVKQEKQTIMDDCYEAQMEAIEMMPELDGIRDMGDM
jgi:hypothetical protein